MGGKAGFGVGMLFSNFHFTSQEIEAVKCNKFQLIFDKNHKVAKGKPGLGQIRQIS